jgi:hypothetical protein
MGLHHEQEFTIGDGTGDPRETGTLLRSRTVIEYIAGWKRTAAPAVGR